MPTNKSENRFAIIVLNEIDSNRMGLIEKLIGLSKKEIDKNIVDSFTHVKRFGFTYYSQEYYTALKKLKTISTKNEVEDIITLFKTEKYLQTIELYKKSHAYDIYASGLSAELFNEACIEKGYNPIGAGIIANKLMRK
jgi:hypothetical protein